MKVNDDDYDCNKAITLCLILRREELISVLEPRRRVVPTPDSYLTNPCREVTLPDKKKANRYQLLLRILTNFWLMDRRGKGWPPKHITPTGDLKWIDISQVMPFDARWECDLKVYGSSVIVNMFPTA